MRYIEQLREGESVREIYLCKNKQSAVTKNGKPYDSVLLQDKTGTLDAKIWDPNSVGIDDFDALDYIEVTGDVTSFNGMLQMSIKRVRKVHEGEYFPGDYLPVSEKDIEEMYKELIGLINSVKNEHLKTLLKKFFVEDSEFITEFKKHSAAKSVHHGFIGGLLEHTLSVVKLCDFYSMNYGAALKRDLLITVAMLHDIGKIWEISDFPVNDYTDDGQLLGHIIIGTEKVSAAINTIPGFPKQLAAEVKHCILAHHGEYEYGSPKKPAIIEALALHYADNTDAKIQTMKELLNSNAGNNDWLGFNRLLDTNVRRTLGVE